MRFVSRQSSAICLKLMSFVQALHLGRFAKLSSSIGAADKLKHHYVT